MNMIRIRRAGIVAAGTTAAIALGAGAASAHHCFVPMYGLGAPSSANWFVISAEMGAQFEGNTTEYCDEAVEAGYDALKAAKLPLGIKIFEKMTIGDPNEEGRMNPNGANGKGLEYFGAYGEELPPLLGEMIGTWTAAADSVDCS
jgi:hypothetical protein